MEDCEALDDNEEVGEVEHKVTVSTAEQAPEQEGCRCSSCLVESICVGIDSISKLLRTKLSQNDDLLYLKILQVGSVLLI